MLFNSLEFLYFLIIILLAYYGSSKSLRLQNILLLAGSYLFYGWWDYRFLGLIVFSTFLDFYTAISIENASSKSTKKRFLLLSMFVNLGLLGFFKYFNFFIDSFNQILMNFGLESSVSTLSIILPVGISFYTFQTMSYTIDVYRGRLKATRNLLNFSLYVNYFPQLVAGPIERSVHLLPQIEQPRVINLAAIKEGLLLILLGFFRKVAIADNAATYANDYFDSPSNFSPLSLMMGVVFFAIQIYGDFAGYSDIARGVSKLLGIDLMVNFRQPYFSTNITEFWRRWHISLSSWLSDYLYIPLGGSRNGRLNTYKNLFLTMLLGGLWHGASWLFVIWGAWHGLCLSLHKIWLEKRGLKVDGQHPKPFTLLNIFYMLFTFVLVCFGWIFFRAQSLDLALEYLSNMTDFNRFGLGFQQLKSILKPGFSLFLMILGLLMIDIPQYRSNKTLPMLDWNIYFQAVFYAVLINLVIFLTGSDEMQFIYFQF